MAVASVVVLVGCGTVAVQPIKTKSETEVAVESIDREWLKECGFNVAMPANSTGNLLQDYTDMAAAFAVCMVRHNELVRMLGPIVKKERER